MTRTIFLSLVTASFLAVPAAMSAQSAAVAISTGRTQEDMRRVEQAVVAARQARPTAQRPVPTPATSGGSRSTPQGQRPSSRGLPQGQRPAQMPMQPTPRAGRGAPPDRQVPQGFSVVLVLGDLQGGATSDNVPAAARKALADMKDFLPYKSYRLLDVQWTLCCSRGSNTSVVSRLRGADGQEYQLSLSTSVEPRDRLGVRFQLREPSASYADAGEVPSEVIVELEREADRLEQQLETATKNARTRAEVGMGRPVDEDPNVQELRSKVALMKIRLAEARSEQRRSSLETRATKRSSNRGAIIDTSFTMDVGETVVVGTSRVAGGDKALIALLTAVAQTDR